MQYINYGTNFTSKVSYGICFYVDSRELLKECGQCTNGHKVCHNCQLLILVKTMDEYQHEGDDHDDAAAAVADAFAAAAAIVAADDDDMWWWRIIIVLNVWSQGNGERRWLRLLAKVLHSVGNTRTIGVPSWLRRFRRYMLEVALGPEILQKLSALDVTFIVFALPTIRYLHCVPKKEATKLLAVTLSNLSRF